MKIYWNVKVSQVSHIEIYFFIYSLQSWKIFGYNIPIKYFFFRIHLSKSHTKEDMMKTCSICDIKTMSLDYHMKIYHFDAYMKKKDLDEPNENFEQQ